MLIVRQYVERIFNLSCHIEEDRYCLPMINRTFILTLFAIANFCYAKTPSENADSLIAEHDKNLAIWKAKVNQANTDFEKSKLAPLRPQTKAYADAVLKAINPYLDRDWVVKHMAWLIRNHPTLVIENALPDGSKKRIDREQIFMDYVERFHLNSPDAGIFVASLIYSERLDPRFIEKKRLLAEKVFQTHANKNNKVMGTAALACGHFVPAISGAVEQRKQIGGYYKTAVMHAYDVKLGEQTVGEIVGEKLYLLKNLSVGSPVPLFQGYDATQKPLQMLDFKGANVVLCFWSQSMPNFNEFQLQLDTFHQKTKLKGIKLLGITKDNVSGVRKLIGNSQITWRNLIDVNGAVSHSFRVNETPHCYVINAKGEIVYTGSFGGPLFGSVITELIQ